MHLKLGNRIPADLRLIASTDLKIEMSSLTGACVRWAAVLRAGLSAWWIRVRALLQLLSAVRFGVCSSGHCRPLVARSCESRRVGRRHVQP